MSSLDLGKQLAGIGAMLAAIGAALALGFGRDGAAPAANPAPAWLEQIETGDDHIDAQELAGELLRARGDVVLVDLRPADEFAAWHLPGALNMTVPQVCGDEGAALLARSPRLVVLCSNGPAHPAQAWVVLQQRGHHHVKVLAGGLDEFKALLLTPPSLREGASEASAKAARPSWDLLRAFVLGSGPMRSGWATDPAELREPTMVSAQWLAARLAQCTVLDVRPASEFAAWHIPGARHLEASSIRVRAGDRDHFVVDDQKLAQTFGALGIGNATSVVIYADDKVQDAAFVAVALTKLGHRALALLEGGVLHWAARRLPLTDEVHTPTPTTYVPQSTADFGITTDELAKAVATGATKVLDVRPPAAFRGEQSTEARPGHIPGALNRPFSADQRRDGAGQWLAPRDELARSYAALAAADEPVVVSCRTGHTAAHTYFVLRHLLGYRQARWYNGSWTEWSARKDLPAATGEQ